MSNTWSKEHDSNTWSKDHVSNTLLSIFIDWIF
jgi:hypothetical protein